MPRPKSAASHPGSFTEVPGLQLVCPACRATIQRAGERYVCRGEDCRRAFVIDDGIPRFTVPESTVLAAEEWRRELGQ